MVALAEFVAVIVFGVVLWVVVAVGCAASRGWLAHTWAPLLVELRWWFGL